MSTPQQRSAARAKKAQEARLNRLREGCARVLGHRTREIRWARDGTFRIRWRRPTRKEFYRSIICSSKNRWINMVYRPSWRMSRNDHEVVEMFRDCKTPARQSAARAGSSRGRGSNGRAPAREAESSGDDTEDEDEMAGHYPEFWRAARKAKRQDKRTVSHTYESSVEFRRCLLLADGSYYRFEVVKRGQERNGEGPVELEDENEADSAGNGVAKDQIDHPGIDREDGRRSSLELAAQIWCNLASTSG